MEEHRIRVISTDSYKLNKKNGKIACFTDSILILMYFISICLSNNWLATVQN